VQKYVSRYLAARARSAYELCQAPGSLVCILHIHIDRVQINASFCLGCQAFHTGFDGTGKKQAIDQSIGHSGDASGVAAFLPGVTHHGHSFLVAHAD